MRILSQFKAVYASGWVIPTGGAVTALALLFERVYLPNNLSLVRAFAEKFRFVRPEILTSESTAKSADSDLEELGAPRLFSDLPKPVRETAEIYLAWSIDFALAHYQLIGEVFETDLFDNSAPSIWTKGDERAVIVSIRTDEEDNFSDLVAQGYVPVVGSFDPGYWQPPAADDFTSKQLAALLAMKSIEMMFPHTKDASPELILEARERLCDHLPPFWAAMLKLSVELKNRIRDCCSSDEVMKEGQDLIDTTVRPTLIELNAKINKERRSWFYKILSPVQKGLRVMVGNPPLTQQQLITNALVLGADVTMATASNLRVIEDLKAQSGLTLLLEFSRMMGGQK